MSNDGYYDESLHDEVIGAGFHEIDEDDDFLEEEDDLLSPKKKASDVDDEDLDTLLDDFDTLPEDDEDFNPDVY